MKLYTNVDIPKAEVEMICCHGVRESTVSGLARNPAFRVWPFVVGGSLILEILIECF